MLNHHIILPFGGTLTLTIVSPHLLFNPISTVEISTAPKPHLQLPSAGPVHREDDATSRFQHSRRQRRVTHGAIRRFSTLPGFRRATAPEWNAVWVTHCEVIHVTNFGLSGMMFRIMVSLISSKHFNHWHVIVILFSQKHPPFFIARHIQETLVCGLNRPKSQPQDIHGISSSEHARMWFWSYWVFHQEKTIDRTIVQICTRLSVCIYTYVYTNIPIYGSGVSS